MSFWEGVASLVAIIGFAGLTNTALDWFVKVRDEHRRRLAEEQRENPD